MDYNLRCHAGLQWRNRDFILSALPEIKPQEIRHPLGNSIDNRWKLLYLSLVRQFSRFSSAIGIFYRSVSASLAQIKGVSDLGLGIYYRMCAGNRRSDPSSQPVICADSPSGLSVSDAFRTEKENPLFVLAVNGCRILCHLSSANDALESCVWLLACPASCGRGFLAATTYI